MLERIWTAARYLRGKMVRSSPPVTVNLRAVEAAIERFKYAWHYNDVRGTARWVQFIGHPRSGHSVLGSILDAHPRAVVAHELDALGSVAEGATRDELFGQTLLRSEWFARQGAQWSGYDYALPSQYKGTYEPRPLLLGDKKGGGTTKWIRVRPGLLQEFLDVVQAKVTLLHVVRHPMDNISTMYRWHDWQETQEEAIDEYASQCETIERVRGVVEDLTYVDVRVVYQDRLCVDSPGVLDGLCRDLGLPHEAAWMEAADEVLFDEPKQTRGLADFDRRDRDQMRSLCDRFEWLERFRGTLHPATSGD